MSVLKAHCHRIILNFALVSLFLSAIGPALAQRNIGSAVVVNRNVSGALGGRTRAINPGDGVFSNENIRTANESAAQFQFLDETRLALGPSASVVLDRFVYNPDRTTREAVVRIATGALRWVSGASQPSAYQVRTPHAVIGVRGTAFDLLVDSQRTSVALREGVIVVCLIRTPQRCATLNMPGQAVAVTRSAIEGPRPAGPTTTQFAERCLRPIDRAACSAAVLAQVSPSCPEGRTVGGLCVSSELSQFARQSAIVATQSKLSYTAPPVPPSRDHLYKYPNALYRPTERDIAVELDRPRDIVIVPGGPTGPTVPEEPTGPTVPEEPTGPTVPEGAISPLE
ncbi:FecR domain-containing protein [Microvirga pakistanensis]|uniref:FecR family protein n=1 Tax=Microvirga pakistanensis TaxID=1682650 RepID=UPI00106D3C4B